MSKIKFLRPKNPKAKLPDIHTGGYWPAKGKRSVVTPYERKLIEDGELVEGEDNDLKSDPSRGIVHRPLEQESAEDLLHQPIDHVGARMNPNGEVDFASQSSLDKTKRTSSTHGIGAKGKPLSETPHESDELDMNRSGKLGKAGKL